MERIAAVLPGPLSPDNAARIFASVQRDVVESFIADLETLATTETIFDSLTGQWATYDKVSLWHKHHAGRNGEVGRWQHELCDDHVQIIERRMRPWMERFRGQTREIRAACQYLQTKQLRFAEACKKILKFIEVTPLFG